VTKKQRRLVDRVKATVNAYLKAVDALLKGRFAVYREKVPPHLARPGTVFAYCCKDGVVLRYDSERSKDKPVRSGWCQGESLRTLLPKVSAGIIYGWDGTTPITEAPSPELELFTFDTQTGQQSVVAKVKPMLAVNLLHRPEGAVPSGGKPFSASLRNSFFVTVKGEVMPEATKDPSNESTPFAVRSHFSFEVDWDCIEIFPDSKEKEWAEEFAPLWAENDLLVNILSLSNRDADLKAGDPTVEARKFFADLLQEFRSLIEAKPDREEVLQRYLRNHPHLLSPTHTRVWPKAKLGTKRVTDFVFLEAPGSYLLVELERDNLRLFNKKGEPSGLLQHALHQVRTWKQFIRTHPDYVRNGDLQFQGMSTNPRSLVVIGRSATLQPQDRHLLQELESENPNNRIWTYDDVLANATAVFENLFGPQLVVEGENIEVYYFPKSRERNPSSAKGQRPSRRENPHKIRASKKRRS